MPALEDAFVGLAGQHLFDIAEAEALAGAIDGAEQFLRRGGGIGDARCIEAIVAIAATGGRILAEMAQQPRPAAFVGFDQRGQRLQPGALACAAARLDFLQPLAGQGKIRRRPQHDRERIITVAAARPVS